MEESKKKLTGYVFAGLVAVGLILVIVGMCLGALKLDFLGQKKSITLFDESWKLNSITDPNFAITSFVIAIIGAAALIAYLALKIFLNKYIKIFGLLSALVSIAGGILIIVAGIIIATKMNNPNGVHIEAYAPGIGIWIGGIGSLLAGIAGVLSISKKFN